jgi:hypothetical protein
MFMGPTRLIPATTPYTFERYIFPLWALAAVVLLPVWWAIAITLVRALLQSARRRKALCESCGYDLRATPQGGRCPECGMIRGHVA